MEQNSKGQWGSNFGFLMAAIGSAVGLGNLWGFPYKIGKHGGFAFLIMYLALVILIGYVISLSELAMGRRSGKGVIGAYEAISKKYAFIGWFAWISPLLILGFYCMLGGYCIKYAIANLGDIFGASWGVGGAESTEFFQSFFTNQLETSIFTIIFVILTVIIVRAGVSNGIEKFTKIAMPILFFMLVAVIIRSVTLPGAEKGLEFLFKPDWSVFQGRGFINTLAAAGGQVFFSLSLGMGIMITYGSYMPKETSLERSAIVIPFADTILAIMSGMAIMPAVFASGQDPAGGPGLIFMTLQTVFQSMGSVGSIFGFLMYFLVFVAAITSSVALLETVISAVIDKQISKGKNPNRSSLTIIFGLIVLAEGVFVALDGLGANGFPQIFGQGSWLDTFDLISEGILMPLGACYMAIIIPTSLVDNELKDNGEKFRTQKFYDFCIKFVAPLIMVLVLLGQIDTFFQLGIFG